MYTHIYTLTSRGGGGTAYRFTIRCAPDPAAPTMEFGGGSSTRRQSARG